MNDFFGALPFLFAIILAAITSFRCVRDESLSMLVVQTILSISLFFFLCRGPLAMRLMLSGSTVTGYVTAHEALSGRWGARPGIELSYRVANQQINVVEAGEYPVGTQLAVYYDPEDPTAEMIVEPHEYLNFNLELMLTFGTTNIPALIWLFITRKTKKS